MDKKDYAVECYKCGFNCAQSVVAAFEKEHGLDCRIALKMSGVFGAGMGYLGETCGAVTGAFLVIGLLYGQEDEDDRYAKAQSYLLVKDFAHRFRKINSAIRCNDLLGIDVSDKVKLNEAKQKDIFETKCQRYVRDAVLILEEIIEENNK